MAIVLPAATVTVDQEDKTLGLVCFDYAYGVLRDRHVAGKLRGYVEATMTANLHLARLDFFLPLGTVVRLPEFVVETRGEQVRRLWED